MSLAAASAWRFAYPVSGWFQPRSHKANSCGSCRADAEAAGVSLQHDSCSFGSASTAGSPQNIKHKRRQKASAAPQPSPQSRSTANISNASPQSHDQSTLQSVSAGLLTPSKSHQGQDAAPTNQVPATHDDAPPPQDHVTAVTAWLIASSTLEQLTDRAEVASPLNAVQLAATLSHAVQVAKRVLTSAPEQASLRSMGHEPVRLAAEDAQALAALVAGEQAACTIAWASRKWTGGNVGPVQAAQTASQDGGQYAAGIVRN